MISSPQKKSIVQTSLFWLILTGGIAARWYHWKEIPLTNDELSALNRLNYPNFWIMLKQAVWTDGHPAGVQVFLWFYTHLFGTAQATVKLPFLILATASLPLFYAAAKRLTNTPTALLVLAALAFLQFPITYAQTIRPYSSGQFLAALTMLIWTYWIPKSGTSIVFSWKTSFLLALCVALSWSNHYFSLLFAFTLLPLGILLNPTNLNWKFVTPWIFAAILYSTQWPIFWHHLKVGSPGWLPTPDFSTLIHHLAYTFQFSYVGIFSVVAWILLRYALKVPFSRRSWIFLAAYLFPILLTFVYSLYRAPLFQDSIFVFSMVFLFLFLGDLPPNNQTIAPKALLLFTITFTLINVHALIFKRKHYQEFYHQGYSTLVQDVYQFEDTALVTPVWVCGFEPFFFNYYQKHNHYKPLTSVFFLREFPKNCRQLFCNNRENQWPESFILAKAIDGPTELLAECQYHYPFVYKSCAHGSEVLLFRKHAIETSLKMAKKPQSILYQSSLKNQFTKEPWSPAIQDSLPYSVWQTTARYVVQLSITKPTNLALWDSIQKHVSLDLRISANQKELRFVPANYKFIDSSTNPHSLVILAATDGYHFEWPRYQQVGLKTYVTNPLKLPLYIKQYQLTIYKGNPSVYSLVNDF